MEIEEVIRKVHAQNSHLSFDDVKRVLFAVVVLDADILLSTQSVTAGLIQALQHERNLYINELVLKEINNVQKEGEKEHEE